MHAKLQGGNQERQMEHFLNPSGKKATESIWKGEARLS